MKPMYRVIFPNGQTLFYSADSLAELREEFADLPVRILPSRVPAHVLAEVLAA